ncbi:hypothetical protein ACFX11_037983 [Malus domestica]
MALNQNKAVGIANLGSSLPSFSTPPFYLNLLSTPSFSSLRLVLIDMGSLGCEEKDDAQVFCRWTAEKCQNNSLTGPIPDLWTLTSKPSSSTMNPLPVSSRHCSPPSASSEPSIFHTTTLLDHYPYFSSPIWTGYATFVSNGNLEFQF